MAISHTLAGVYIITICTPKGGGNIRDLSEVREKITLENSKTVKRKYGKGMKTKVLKEWKKNGRTRKGQKTGEEKTAIQHSDYIKIILKLLNK